MSVLGQTCDEKCAAYDSCVEAGTADCSAAETQCSTCMNSEQQGFNQPAQSYGQLMGALADPWALRYSAPAVRGVRIRRDKFPAERAELHKWWHPMSPAERACRESASAELQERMQDAFRMLRGGDWRGYNSAINAAFAELNRKVRQCDDAAGRGYGHVDAMAIPFMGDTKTFTGKDWAMLFGLLVLVVVLVYLLWARRR